MTPSEKPSLAERLLALEAQATPGPLSIPDAADVPRGRIFVASHGGADVYEAPRTRETIANAEILVLLRNHARRLAAADALAQADMERRRPQEDYTEALEDYSAALAAYRAELEREGA